MSTGEPSQIIAIGQVFNTCFCMQNAQTNNKAANLNPDKLNMSIHFSILQNKSET
jgi:hypothetical protein